MYAFFHSLGGSGAGSPPLTNLWGWWHAGEVYSDTACTVRQTTNGGSIAGLLDLSGNSRNLTQATGANQPVLDTTLNGIDFDGTNDFFTRSGPAMPFTFYIVVEFDLWTANRSLLTHTNGVSSISTWQGGSSPQVGIFNGASTGALVSATLGSKRLVGVSYDSVAALGTLIIDSTSATVGSLSNVPASPFYLGSTHVGSGYLNGKISEFLIYTGVHTFGSGDGLLARQYLNVKYNLGLGI